MHTVKIPLERTEVDALEERLLELASARGKPLNFSLLLPVGKAPSLVGFFKNKLDALTQLRLLGLEARARHGHLKDRDWQDSVKKHFRPFAYRNVIFAPVWATPKQLSSLKKKIAAQKDSPVKIIRLEIGMAFGTGNHPTTRLCLRRLIDALEGRKRPSLVDIGCGSGILAITAQKLGATRAEGFDIDAHSIVVARRNARLNRSTAKFAVRDLYKTRLAPADVVLANLLGNLITDNAQKLWAAVKPGGALILSGLLKSELDSIAALFPVPARKTVLGQWGVLVLRRG